MPLQKMQKMIDMMAKPVLISANVNGTVITFKVMATQIDVDDGIGKFLSPVSQSDKRIEGMYSTLRFQGIIVEMVDKSVEEELLGKQNDISGLLGSLGSRKLTLGEQNAAPETQEGREDLPNLR